jgi:predicted small lipoprotein YifL
MGIADMTRSVTALLLLAALAACGADGQPVRPAPATPPAATPGESAVTIGGDARMGVVRGS